jgi:hypothetical protein
MRLDTAADSAIDSHPVAFPHKLEGQLGTKLHDYNVSLVSARTIFTAVFHVRYSTQQHSLVGIM